MKWSVGTKIGTGFGVALVLLLVVGTICYRSTTQLVATADLVAHTNEVRFRLRELLSLLQDAETGQRGYIITGEKRYLEPYTNAIANLTKDVEDLKALTADNPNQQRRLEAVEPLIAQKLSELEETISLRKNKGFEVTRQEVVNDKGKAVMDEIRKIYGEMDKEESDLAKVRDAAARATDGYTRTAIIAGTILTFVFVTLSGLLITQNIAKPLTHVSTAAERIASGDLTVTVISKNRADEVGVLARSFTRMVQFLRDIAQVAERISGGDLRVTIRPLSEKDALGNALATMLENLRRVNAETKEATNVLASCASEIVAATTQVASGVSETDVAVSESIRTVQQVKQTAEVSSQKAKYVSESAQTSAQVSQAGKKAVEDTIAVMDRIREQVESIAESIVRLSEQSQAIGGIIATVNDLADQSNLLAVNAAIEAARAGEQGKGFAVVAQEVKNLAEQSKQATAQVRTILGDIQKATTATVMATEQGSKAVELGVKQSTEAGESIRALADSVSEARQAAIQIAASAQQQLVGMDQVALAMENIKLATTQNVASTKQAETVAQNLHGLGQKLMQLIQHYQV